MSPPMFRARINSMQSWISVNMVDMLIEACAAIGHKEPHSLH